MNASSFFCSGSSTKLYFSTTKDDVSSFSLIVELMMPSSSKSKKSVSKDRQTSLLQSKLERKEEELYNLKHVTLPSLQKAFKDLEKEIKCLKQKYAKSKSELEDFKKENVKWAKGYSNLKRHKAKIECIIKRDGEYMAEPKRYAEKQHRKVTLNVYI